MENTLGRVGSVFSLKVVTASKRQAFRRCTQGTWHSKHTGWAWAYQEDSKYSAFADCN